MLIHFQSLILEISMIEVSLFNLKMILKQDENNNYHAFYFAINVPNHGTTSYSLFDSHSAK